MAGPFEFGTFDATKGKRGTRTDLKEATDLIASGATLRQVAISHPDIIVKYPTGMEKLSQLLAPDVPTQRDIFVHVLWGPTGTGKTHRVRMGVPPDQLFVVSPGRDPWENYSGEKTVCFEEFDPNMWPLDKLKELLDKWPCKLCCRYAGRTARWNHVLMLSNTHPDTWYRMTASPANQAALARRIHRVTEVLDQEQVVELYPAVIVPPTPTPSTPTTTTLTSAPAAPIPSASAAGTSYAPAAPRATTPVVISSDEEMDTVPPVPLKLNRANARARFILSDHLISSPPSEPKTK